MKKNSVQFVLLSHMLSLLPAQNERVHVSLAVISWIYCCSCLRCCIGMSAADASSPAVSVSECTRINWGVLSYLGLTAVSETEKSDEALFCGVRVTTGAVCAG